MNRCIVIIAVAFLDAAVLLLNVSDANSEDVNVFSGVHYASISDSRLLSGTMTLNKNGGVFKTLVDSGDVLALNSGETLVSSFKLPENSNHINVSIDFYASNDSAKGQIHWNGVLLSGKEFELKRKNAQRAFSSVSFPLNGAQVQNELKILSVEGEVCIHRIKINYDYPMPYCSKHNVTVVLTSPVSNTDIMQQDIRFEWRIIGDYKNGWISLRYDNNGSWETVPDAELLDCQAQKTCGTYGEFIWKNHGLSAIPEFQIEYYDYKNDPLPNHFSRKMRPAVLNKADSINLFNDLIKRFLDEDNELFNTIVFTYNNKTEYIPAKQTKREAFLHYWLKTPAARLVDTQSSQKEIAELREERKKKDLDVEYKLLSIETINKNLRLFKSLEDSIDNLRLSIEKRIDDLNQYTQNRIKSQTLKQKKFLETARNEIKKFRLIVDKKKMEYISYSVVSPYLADAARALEWNLPNCNEKIDMLYLMYKNEWIRYCSDDVKMQFSELLMKNSDTYPKIKKLIEEIQASAKKPKLKN